MNKGQFILEAEIFISSYHSYLHVLFLFSVGDGFSPCRLVLEAQNPNNPIPATEECSVGFADAAPWRRVGDTQLLFQPNQCMLQQRKSKSSATCL